MIETERLILAPISDAQMEQLIRDEQDAEMKQAYSEMLQGCREHPQERIWYAVWTMRLRESPDIIVGDLSFKGLSPEGMAEIGYGLRDGCCGHGYMTEAVKAVCQWALQSGGAALVEAETEPGNTASQRVLGRAGFVPNGRMGAEGPRFTYCPEHEAEKV